MTQDRLNNDEFLARLTTLLTTTHAQSHGSIYLTQKPLPSSSSDDTTSPYPYQILIRATNGLSSTNRTKSLPKGTKPTTKSKPEGKIKFATVVEQGDLEGFYTRYGEICKKGMEGLRKRDKKKAKERAKAKKKGKGGP